MYNTQVIESIKEKLLAYNHTLCVAESVTSGHLQAAISLAREASKFFQGGMTAYNLGQKARHLHVNPIHATSCNSVSETIADEMALSVLALFSSDWSIGITGYASLVPEMGINELFAFYTIAFRKRVRARGKINCDDLGPLKVQVYYANHVLKHFDECLERVTMEGDGRRAR